MEEHKKQALWTREESINKLKWLVDQSILSIKHYDSGYVKKGTADAILGAIKELNTLEGLGKERDAIIRLNENRIVKTKAEIDRIKGISEEIEDLSDIERDIYGDS